MIIYDEIFETVSNNRYKFKLFKFFLPIEFKEDICEIDDIGFSSTAYQPFKIDDIGTMMCRPNAKKIELDEHI